ncbi:hypothetical protein GUITHDRAFT_102188 [Guillardia theta CCMP2712]|uniref:K Homology domain-containing protein n=1 Tax=Guillardia theta (strain CCMP2712) TaxID=905079 RepID=L1JVT7_GUITC|nr:hypothetical protein GUITHDRAFT_102188 [Guillardia theta CCMP2712]EKX52285.1 hypothetical protein GUITHDRAFT_102188 [Guillardia theta CCMP2712]|eukprot:XP_005839265.1 hypothetical protein GUITHDRAFT_102188 [Guillardia theta CCMP2712]
MAEEAWRGQTPRVACIRRFSTSELPPNPEKAEKKKSTSKEAKVKEILKVEKEFSFLIIGNKRENINRITAATKTIIYLSKHYDGAERDIEIRGSAENVARAKEMILESIKGIVKLEVPKSVLPFLIGRGGVNVRKLTEDTGVRMRVCDAVEQQEHVEIVLYGAPAENIQAAKKRIDDVVAAKASAPAVRLEKEIFDVSNAVASAIIGRGGANIKKIQSDTNAKLFLQNKPGTEDEDGNAQREIIIVGDSKSVQAAKAVVTDIMSDTQQMRDSAADHAPKHAVSQRTPKAEQRKGVEQSYYLYSEDQTEAIECEVAIRESMTTNLSLRFNNFLAIKKPIPPQEDAFTCLDADAEIQRLKDQGHKMDDEWIEYGKEIAAALNLNPTFTYSRKRSLFRLAMKAMNAEDPMYLVRPVKLQESEKADA